MGRGGYNGGSTIVGPGSGWFGYGKPKQRKKAVSPAPPKPARSGKKGGKRNKALPTPREIRSAEEARKRGLTRAEWIARADKRVSAIEEQVRVARSRLRNLEGQLARALAEREKAKTEPPLSQSKPSSANAPRSDVQRAGGQ